MKQFLFGSLLLLSLSAFAQDQRPPGPPKPPPVAERWKRDSSKIVRAVTLSAAQLKMVKASFLIFYKDLDALMEKGKLARPDKAAVDVLIAKRNSAVKKTLSAEQAQQFSGIERQLMPPPPGDKKEPPPTT